MGRRRATVTGVLTSVFLFALVNVLWERRNACWDCFAPHGRPFAYFREGGFGGGGGYVWGGIAGDFLAILAVGAAIAWALSRLGHRVGSRAKFESRPDN